MSRTKHARKQPLHKRYPGQYAVRAVLHTPNGTRVEASGPIAEPSVGRLMLALMVASVGRMDPGLAAELATVADDLEKRHQKRRATAGGE
jgi:hypothetical protein